MSKPFKDSSKSLSSDNVKYGGVSYILDRLAKKQNVILTILGFLYPENIALGLKFFGRLVYSETIRQRLHAGTGMYIYKDINIRGHQYISIGRKFYAQGNFILQALDSYENERYTPEIIIGNNVSLGFDCHIGAINKIHIGDNVMMGSKILITDHFHGRLSADENEIPVRKRPLYSKGEVIIENNVWVGDGVAIMPGVHIGSGAVIGVNSVVTKNIPPRVVVAGSPARVIREMV